MANAKDEKPAEKKLFLVRDGFVVDLETITKGTGGSETKSVKTLGGGEKIQLTYDEYLEHAHKLEYANQKDIDAALEEEAERAKAKTVADPLAAFTHLITAIMTQAAATGALPSLTPAPAEAPAAE
jgi:microcystin-dependent protein